MNGPGASSATRSRGARQARDDAAVLRAESRTTRRHAAAMHAETNAILDTVGELIARALQVRGFALRAPVTARFRTRQGGSTGLEIVVRLEDPRHADAAMAALLERYPDPLSDVIIG
jgi:hypothetical protein